VMVRAISVIIVIIDDNLDLCGYYLKQNTTSPLNRTFPIKKPDYG